MIPKAQNLGVKSIYNRIYFVVEALNLDEVLSEKINSIINRLDP